MSRHEPLWQRPMRAAKDIPRFDISDEELNEQAAASDSGLKQRSTKQPHHYGQITSAPKQPWPEHPGQCEQSSVTAAELGDWQRCSRSSRSRRRRARAGDRTTPRCMETERQRRFSKGHLCEQYTKHGMTR